MNHGFVITKGKVSGERLDKLLREIVSERWGELVTVSRDGDNWEIKWGTDYSFGLHVWIATARKIELRKQLGQMSGWLQDFMRESLAARLKGKCGDQGVHERWEGKPEDWQTFRQWWDAMHSHVEYTPDEQRFLEHVYTSTIKGFPTELLCTPTSDSRPAHA